MGTVLLDAHAWAWSLSNPEFLSEAAYAAIASADAAYVSPVSIFEISRKARLGKWPGMEPHATHLVDLLREQGSEPAPLTPEICLDAGRADWPHRDPFDRLLAATSRRMGVPLVTRDAAFAGMGVACVW